MTRAVSKSSRLHGELEQGSCWFQKNAIELGTKLLNLQIRSRSSSIVATQREARLKI